MISPNNQTYGSSNIIHIRGGLDGAKNYPVTPGYVAMLLDEEVKKFFIKTTGANGVPNIREFDYEEVNRETPIDDTSKYATKDDFNMLMGEIKKLQSGQRNNYKYNNYRRNYGNGKSHGKTV